jgi:hypothetical protein
MIDVNRASRASMGDALLPNFNAACERDRRSWAEPSQCRLVPAVAVAVPGLGARAAIRMPEYFHGAANMILDHCRVRRA